MPSADIFAPNGLTPATETAPPCFYWSHCGRRASIEKAGRCVCLPCAATLRGTEYPLRDASVAPLYITGRDAAEALDMIENRTPARGLELNGLRLRPPSGGRVFTTPAR